jgi:competence protein ComEA
MMNNRRIIYFFLIAVILSGSFVYLLNHFLLKKEEIIILSGTDPENSFQSAKPTTKEAYVHISGAVKYPGVYRLKKEMRMIEAVKIAGGITMQADLDSVNLAENIKDGQKIHIPSKIYCPNIETPENKTGKKTNKIKNKTLNIKVNINSAKEKELQKLPGVGPSLSKKILTYRSGNGSFKTVNDLLKVPGIGKKKLEKIKDHICL